MTTKTLIPETLYVQGARALSDAINLVAAAQELCDRVAALMSTTDTLTKGMPDVDDTSEAWRWSDATGIGAAHCALIAIADNITKATGSTSSYLAGKTAAELREQFESQLPANET